MGIYWCLIGIDSIDDLTNKFKTHIYFLKINQENNYYAHSKFCIGENYFGRTYRVKIKMT